ncbi:MAG: tRNA threonylcarbamoyladenosine dehydratase [Zoogloeaceae bacterium]|jgi:tRNA A37 threonylcarbamoyladenosine dehydratase|nr:tRNA threonylcarbamoyladenosine dehydratase [Zoogloeaceae bacterium]
MPSPDATQTVAPGSVFEPVPDLDRRFGGIKRLYGDAAAQKMQAAHVCVVGVGGVGSWAVEALARSGVGCLTLIDLDMVAESNTNRQIQALGEEYGKAKVEVMAGRIAAINPACRIHAIEDFVSRENVAALLSGDLDAVVDAIDEARVKAAIIAHCRTNGIPVVTAGAAGGQTDPTRIRRDDLAYTLQDPLLAKVRTLLRREYGFASGASGKKGKPEKFGVPAIYSTEPLRYPEQVCTPDSSHAPQSGSGGLNCAGFGSSVCVTAPIGFAAAATALEQLINPVRPEALSKGIPRKNKGFDKLSPNG